MNQEEINAKARELVEQYLNADFNCKGCDMPYCDVGCTKLNISQAKQCAFIACDLLIQDNYKNENIVNGGLNSEYWEQVKQSIENL